MFSHLRIPIWWRAAILPFENDEMHGGQIRSVNAPRTGEMLSVEPVVEIGDLDALASFRRVNKLVVTEIDADMRHVAANSKKYQVSGPGQIQGYRAGSMKLFPRGTRDRETRFTVCIKHESATVEAFRGRTAPDVGDADHLLSDSHHMGARGGAGFDGPGVAARGVFGIRGRLRWIP